MARIKVTHAYRYIHHAHSSKKRADSCDPGSGGGRDRREGGRDRRECATPPGRMQDVCMYVCACAVECERTSTYSALRVNTSPQHVPGSGPVVIRTYFELITCFVHGSSGPCCMCVYMRACMYGRGRADRSWGQDTVGRTQVGVGSISVMCSTND